MGSPASLLCLRQRPLAAGSPSESGLCDLDVHALVLVSCCFGSIFDLLLRLKYPQAVTPGCPVGLAPQLRPQALGRLWAALGEGLLPCSAAAPQAEAPSSQHVVWAALLTSR